MKVQLTFEVTDCAVRPHMLCDQIFLRGTLSCQPEKEVTLVHEVFMDEGYSWVQNHLGQEAYEKALARKE